jgi:hypothetical protein
MNRNILKLTSMLFVGLVLATSCSKDKDNDNDKDKAAAETGKNAALEFAKQVAVDVAASIDGFNTAVAPYTTAVGVRTTALAFFKVLKPGIVAAKSEASDPAKAELDKAITAIDAYVNATVSVATTGTPVVTAEVVEKGEAKKAADDAKAAVEKAATL